MFHLKQTCLLAVILAFCPIGAKANNNLQRDVFAPRQVIVTSGWEKQLVEGDPNLKQWNWSAMYSVVGKPRTTPMPHVDHRSVGLSQAKSYYVKPTQSAIPKNVLAQMAKERRLPMGSADHSSNRQSSSTTSLKFSTRRTSATLAYGQNYQSAKIEPACAKAYQSASGTVHGKLLSSGF